MSEAINLANKNLDRESLAIQAEQDPDLLARLLQGISSQKQTQAVRENCSQTLIHLAQTQSRLLLPHWNYFMELLGSDNGFSKMAAIHILSALVAEDDQGCFEAGLEAFYDLLDDKSVMVASHVAGVSGMIVKAKPVLESKITARLLEINDTQHEPGRKELVKSYILQAFSEYFPLSGNKDAMIEFARQQLNSSSPKTRQAAKELIHKAQESMV